MPASHDMAQSTAGLRGVSQLSKQGKKLKEKEACQPDEGRESQQPKKT